MSLLSREALLKAHHGMLLDGLTNVFGPFNPEMLNHVLPQVQWIELGGGEVLFHEGDNDESLFFVVSGRLRASCVNATGQRSLLGEIARGETVGEMAFFTGEPRTATVMAVRDSVLARFSNTVFHELLLAYPLVSLNMTRQVIDRFKRVNSGRRVPTKPVIIGVMGISRNVDAADFAWSLARHLQSYGGTIVVTSRHMDEQLGEPGAAQASRADVERSRRVTVRLDKIEALHDFVVFVADELCTEWTQRCVRHCDELLLLADADEPPTLHPNEVDLHASDEAGEAQRTLVLLHPDSRRSPTQTVRWFDGRRLSGHNHVRRGVTRDWQRLARVVCRNTVGLVLSGGGARGFAHLGVMRAMEEAGIEVDLVAGTSIGAVMAAYAGMDMPAPEMIAAARTAFRENPTGDYNVVPLMSLISGKRLRRVIDSAVVNSRGQHIDIEDLWKSYFCITSNYSTAREAVHTRGPLAKSIRASVSIPGALPPVMLDGELHTDGGTFNNFPADVMNRRGAARIIGVDLLRDRGLRYELDEVPGSLELMRDKLRGRASKYHLPSLTSLLLNTSLMCSYARQQEALSVVDLHFAPIVYGFGMLEWSKFDKIVDAGYCHGVEQLEKMGDAAIAPYRYP
ncbi:patatin-like phospholipase family protein [Rhodoferax sp.]|uniref:patatin-like phospholipase family protein n=1 Tax=Rhodoferax sp. TaxID=50421 RepID=UPI00284C7961|nr:patatin-like phospholipase family protein [Rhodoferax sp.]MDR3370878.1 patatin-like phospholipase family protein [Rhodoferax sp.]